MTTPYIIISVILIMGVLALMALFHRRFHNRLFLAVILTVSLLVGITSARKKYEGAEALARFDRMPKELRATIPESAHDYIVVEWKIFRGCLIGCGTSLAAMIFLGMYLNKKNLQQAGPAYPPQGVGSADP